MEKLLKKIQILVIFQGITTATVFTGNNCRFVENLLKTQIFVKEISIFLPVPLGCDDNRVELPNSVTLPNSRAGFNFLTVNNCGNGNGRIKRQKFQNTEIILMCSTIEIVQILQEFKMSLVQNTIWIWHDSQHNITTVTKVMNKLNINRVVVFETLSNGGMAEARQIWRPVPKGQFVNTLIFKRETTFRRKFEHIPFSEGISSDFGGQPLKIAGVLNSAYDYDTRFGKNSKATVFFESGFAVEIVWGLERTLNFRSVPVVTTAWGHLVNSTWKGMIGMLLEGKAHLGISSTADKPFRRTVVHFNHPTSTIHLSCFFQRPLPPLNSNPLSRPFQINLWIAVGAFVLIIGVASGVILGIGHHYGFSDVWTLAESFQWALCVVCFRSYNHRLPRVCPFRILGATALLTSVVLYAAYAATLLSFLFAQVEPIRTIEELVASQFQFLVSDDPMVQKILSESQNPSDQEIYQRRDTTYRAMDDAVDQMNSGKSVFVVDNLNGYESILKGYTITEACSLREIPIAQSSQPEGSMVLKGAEITRVVDFQILRMFEFGLVNKWRRTHFHQMPHCDQRRAFDGVQFEAIQITLWILGGGMVLALVILRVEFYQSINQSFI